MRVFETILMGISLNLQCVGEDIENLEYTPKPEYEGFFNVTNVKNEVKITFPRCLLPMVTFF